MARILIVDDEDIFLEFSAHALKAAGHTVTLTTSPQIAISLVETDAPDLVISDINMSEMTGFEMAAIFNAESTRRWVPVIFMSSRDDGPSFQKAFGIGAVDYLVKPFKREALVETVAKKLIETARRREAGELPQTTVPMRAGESMPVILGYTLISPLGEGGMGHVYLADRIKTKQRCALKILTLVDEGREQTEILTRFLEERALLSQIDHPGVAKVFDHGINDNHVYIAMEYFPCGDLKLAIARGISVATSLGYVRQIAEGLGTVHARGIIHRDIKPANIMLRNDGSIALVDFGIAKALDALSALTVHGETLGTPHYMSPEQINGGTLDARSDLYSLGAMFYEMLAQRRMFAGDRMESILMQHLHAPRPLLPRELRILQPLLDMLLCIAPAGRYADTAAFLTAFSVVELMSFSADIVAGNKSFAGMTDLDTLPGAGIA